MMFREFLNARINKTYVNDRTGEVSERRVVNGKFANISKIYNIVSPHFAFVKNFKDFKINALNAWDGILAVLMVLSIPMFFIGNVYETLGLPSFLGLGGDPLLVQMLVTAMAYVVLLTWLYVFTVTRLYFKTTFVYTKDLSSPRSIYKANPRAISLANKYALLVLVIMVVAKIFI